MEINEMIHELKTPIVIIKGYAELLATKQNLSSEDCLAYISKIYSKCIDTERLFLTMSTLLKSSDSSKEIDFVTVDFNTLVKDCIEDFSVIFADKKLDVTFYSDCKVLNCQLNHMAITGVVQNLIQNAVKYTPKGGKIHISTAFENGDVTFTIKDTGIGLDPEECDRIFNRYYTSQSSSGITKDTFGLGLSICYELIEAHKGKVWATSPLDEGLTVCFSLPECH